MPTPPRQQLAVFLAATAVLTLIGHLLILKNIGTVNTVWTFALMWVPGLVALGCSTTFGHHYRDLGLKAPAPRYMVAAYLVPMAAAILILILSVAIGIGASQFFWDKSTMNRLIFAPTLGVLMGMVATAGEELGWRGFLHSRLTEIGIEAPYLCTGLIWAVWHWPLILFGDYATSKLPLVSLALFTISIVSFSIFLGQLRQASRSVWPAVLAHAAHNTWIQGIYPHFYKAGPLDPFFGGESGVILAILYLCLAIYLQWRPLVPSRKGLG